MKRILLIIALCTFAFTQVPDSVIVNRIAELKVEFDKNVETIAKNIEINNGNYARQDYIIAQVQALEALLKREEMEVKE